MVLFFSEKSFLLWLQMIDQSSHLIAIFNEGLDPPGCYWHAVLKLNKLVVDALCSDEIGQLPTYQCQVVYLVESYCLNAHRLKWQVRMDR
jgi:hypothetical protein